MAYTSLEQLTDRFGESTLVGLTDRGETATGLIDTDVVDRALADTDAQIDMFLSVRYKLPLASTPPAIADIAQVIAVWKLHVFAPDSKIEMDYKGALSTLRDLSTGVQKLDLAGVEPEGSDGSGVEVTDRERPLQADKMKGFI